MANKTEVLHFLVDTDAGHKDLLFTVHSENNTWFSIHRGYRASARYPRDAIQAALKPHGMKATQITVYCTTLPNTGE